MRDPAGEMLGCMTYMCLRLAQEKTQPRLSVIDRMA